MATLEEAKDAAKQVFKGFLRLSRSQRLELLEYLNKEYGAQPVPLLVV